MELFGCEHKEIPIECVTENQSLLETVYLTKNIKDKQLKADIAILRNMFQQGRLPKSSGSSHYDSCQVVHQLPCC